MALPSLSWGRYISIVLLYWVLVVGGWRFYTTRLRPPRRLREHLIAERTDPVTGGMILTFSYRVNVLPIGALLFGPPLALLIVWLAFRRQ